MYPRRKWRLVDDFQTARVRGGSDMIGNSEFPLYVSLRNHSHSGRRWTLNRAPNLLSMKQLGKAEVCETALSMFKPMR